MLFSRNGFKSVDTTEAFVKEALEFGNKDVVLSLVQFRSTTRQSTDYANQLTPPEMGDFIIQFIFLKNL